MDADTGPNATHRGRKPILVIDDDPGHRFACRELLEERGYAVEEAADGRKAIHQLTDEGATEPGLILLDLSMPFMDGWELLAIMKSYMRLYDIPVVLVSANEPRLDPVKHGTIAAHLRKPYEPEQLLALVEAIARWG